MQIFFSFLFFFFTQNNQSLTFPASYFRFCDFFQVLPLICILIRII